VLSFAQPTHWPRCGASRTESSNALISSHHETSSDRAGRRLRRSRFLLSNRIWAHSIPPLPSPYLCHPDSRYHRATVAVSSEPMVEIPVCAFPSHARQGTASILLTKYAQTARLSAAPKEHCYYGVMAATGDALRRCSDNMFCNTATASYFTLVSSLCLVGAQYARHGFTRWGAWGDKQRAVA
jgi:hypothetical protein